MLKKRPSPPASPPSDRSSIIGPGMSVIGDCKTTGAIHVEGRVEGDVEAGAAVVVGKNGVVRGNISAEDAVVSGRVEGNLTVSSRLKMRTSGRVEGDVDAQRIVMEDGAVIDGTLKMGS
ncbi:MAG: polymer-forming cytoskeletal protein [Gammaproteobacteria bacterium]|nr:polymer-forming cytoskeletal protein [Gammaproteobacteria bacterium]MDE0650105.1 polymer-forming cytoskeletal protein [Gammaproteobacteria bacterium]